MEDRTRVALGAVVGAALGAFVGFLFTARGKYLRSRLEPHVDLLAHEGAEPLRRAVFGQWAPVADLLLNARADDRPQPDRRDARTH